MREMPVAPGDDARHGHRVPFYGGVGPERTARSIQRGRASASSSGLVSQKAVLQPDHAVSDLLDARVVRDDDHRLVHLERPSAQGPDDL